MVARPKSWRVAGKPPEDRHQQNIKSFRECKGKQYMQTNESVKIGPPMGAEKQKEQQVVRELPYVNVPPLPFVKRVPSVARLDEQEEELVVQEPGFKNRAPLQSDEKAKDLVQNALRNPISITTEDLLNVSEPMRQELRKLLTKKRLENKTVAFASEVEMDEDVDSARGQVSEVEEVNMIYIDKLPSATCEVTAEDMDGVPKGSLVISDPVVQYLSTLQPGEKPKSIIVARESQSLRAVYPLINNVGEAESLLDGGSQIVSMSKAVAVELEVTWDPDVTVQIQSANRTPRADIGFGKEYGIFVWAYHCIFASACSGETSI